MKEREIIRDFNIAHINIYLLIFGNLQANFTNSARVTSSLLVPVITFGVVACTFTLYSDLYFSKLNHSYFGGKTNPRSTQQGLALRFSRKDLTLG